jgi:hypothetical protein
MKHVEGCQILAARVVSIRTVIEGVRGISIQYMHQWNITGKNLWAINIYLNNGQECKTGLVRRRALVGGGVEMAKWRWRWSMYFMYIYEDRTLKPVKVILSMREGDRGKWWGDVTLTKHIVSSYGTVRMKSVKNNIC